MAEISTKLLGGLVTGRKREGRCTYDPQAKSEVVQACIRPGVSVSRIAMQCDVNANLPLGDLPLGDLPLSDLPLSDLPLSHPRLSTPPCSSSTNR